MTEIAAPAPDTADMMAVHDVFRDVLGAAPVLIGGADAGRRELISNLYSNVLHFLAGHHHGEDLLVFPRLIERRPADADEVRRIAAQHHDVDGALAGATESLARWTAGDDDAAPRAAASLAELGAVLAAHLEEEEREVLPMCEASLTVAEWGELPAHGMQTFAGDKIWLIQGLIRERMTQEQRDLMLSHMPPPAAKMWTEYGEAAFNDLMNQVGAPLR